jgi:nucleoside-diphosphate-sugar epimerase
MTQRLLVIGGNGFIGRHVVEHAIGLDWHVSSLNLSIPQGLKNDSKVNYIASDVTSKSKLMKAMAGTSYDYVVNCSGYIDHSLFSNGGRKVFDAHFLGVMNLVEALNNNQLKAFVNIGSSDEYGNIFAPQSETQREAPISPYSMGKVAATHFLQMLHRTEDFPAITLRLFLTYGPGQDQHRFFPQIIKGCLEGRSFPTSAGEQLRDFCYIQDTVNAIFSSFSSHSALGEVINIASGQPVSVRHMIETVVELIGDGKPEFGEIAYRRGENMELYADVSKARKLLGWKPKISLEDGLSKTIKWVEESL